MARPAGRRHRAAGRAGRPRHPALGGTILGSSRTNPLADAAASGGRSGITGIKDNLDSLGVDVLIAIGGEDTLGVATRLHEVGVSTWSACPRPSTTISARPTTHRFRHRREHRDGGHRPAAHYGGESSPGADRRGSWAVIRLDRAARRMAGGANVHPDPGEAVRHREGLRVRGAPVPDPLRAHRGGARGRRSR